MRLVMYGGASTMLATSAVLAAFRQRANFYAASVYLSKSNACMMILCNFGIFCTVLFSKLLQSIFFGKLRSIELERLHDRLWFTVTETLLALAMFRDEFDTTFVVLFVSLIFVKCFHWLAADRIEWMDQLPTPPGKLFHARMISVLSLIWITDTLLIAYATESVLLHGPSVVLMFEMEYIIMQVTCLSIICKYALNSYGQYRAQEHWEEKSTYLFYIDLATDFLKLLTYIGFLSLTVTFYGLPINVLRDVYYTARSFYAKCHNLVRFRQATRNMNERYPNATQAEMESLADKTCIICREDMEFRDDSAGRADVPAANPDGSGPNDTPKKLPCGHIFHFHCLRSWLERQQTCPTCRRPVLQSTPAPTTNRQANGLAAAQPIAPPDLFGLRGPPQPNAAGAAPLPPAGGGPFAGTNHARNDFQQRLREIQQRLTNDSQNAGAPANASNGLRTAALPGNPAQGSSSNPLTAFQMPSPRNGRFYHPSADAEPSATGLSNSQPINHLQQQNVEATPAQSTASKPNYLPLPQETAGSDLLRDSNATAEKNGPATVHGPEESSFVSSASAPTPQGLALPPVPGDGGSNRPNLGRTLSSSKLFSSQSIPVTAAMGLPLPYPNPTSMDLNLLNATTNLKADQGRLKDSTTGIESSRQAPRNKDLPTLADVETPCLIPLFDTETYTVPESLRRERFEDEERLGRLIDKSSIMIPMMRFEGSKHSEVIKNGLEEQLKVLLKVQENLMDCSAQIRNALGIKQPTSISTKGKEKADED